MLTISLTGLVPWPGVLALLLPAVYAVALWAAMVADRRRR